MAHLPHNPGGSNATFGQRGPTTLGPYQPDTRGMTAGTDALADAARTTGNVLGGLAEQSRAIEARQRQEVQQLARAKAANATLDAELQAKAKVAEIRDAVATGAMRYEEAPDALETWLSLREPPEIDGLDPVDAEHYQGGFKRLRFAAQAEVDGVVVGARRADGKAQVAGIRDNLGKSAADPNADMAAIVGRAEQLRAVADQFGVGATFDKEHQDFVDRAWFDNARARLVAATDDPEGLAQLERDVSEEGGRYFGKLDAGNQVTLLGQIQTRRAQLDAKLQIEADKGEAAAGRALDAFEKQISSGVSAPLETLTGWKDAITRGTPEQQAKWQELVAGEVEVRRVLQQPPAQQAAFVAAERARQQRDGATLAQQANLKRLESAVERGTKLLRESPLDFYSERTGQDVPMLDLNALGTGDIGALRGQITARLNTIAAMRKQYGEGVGMAPLLPREAQALTDAVQKMTPANAVKFYGAMRDAFGDNAAYLGALGQVAKDAPVHAQAGAIARSNPKGAMLILQGAKLLAGEDEGRAGKLVMPPDKDLQTKFAELMGLAFRERPQAYEQALRVVRAAYAGAAATDGDATGQFDEKRLRDVVRFAIGVPVTVNGSKVIAPPGSDEDTFGDQLEAAWRAAPKPKDAGDLDRYELRTYGNGAYRLVRGRQYLMGTDGKPLTLRVPTP